MTLSFEMPSHRAALSAILISSIAACTLPETSTPLPEAGVAAPTRNGPAGAADGTCWGKTLTPAVLERVRERVEVSPAVINTDGTIAKPPVYRSEERQVIVTPRQENWFETPCEDVLTPEFVGSLQRALLARGAYSGPVSGTLDVETRAAVQAFQRQQGLNSPVLSVETARTLGLVAVDLSPPLTTSG